jgi:alcohol dehydrogenase class IV
MEVNLRALEERAPEGDALHRYDEIAQILTGKDEASAMDGVTWVRELCEALNIPPLATYGMRQADGPAVIEKSAVASSMEARFNSRRTVGDILARAFVYWSKSYHPARLNAVSS